MLRSSLLLGTLLLPSFGLEIQETKNFSVSIEPSVMQISFDIEAKSNNINSLQELFASINESIASHKLCQGGHYSIEPQYSYANQLRRFDGYGGRISYRCTFKETKDFDELLSELAPEKYTLSLHPIIWQADTNSTRTAQQSLEKSALRYTLTRSTELEDQLSIYTCKPKRMEFISNTPVPFSMHTNKMMATLSMDSETTAPTQDAITLNLQVSYLFQCRSKKKHD